MAIQKATFAAGCACLFCDERFRAIGTSEGTKIRADGHRSAVSRAADTGFWGTEKFFHNEFKKGIVVSV